MKLLSIEYLESLKPNYVKQGYPVPKWISFSEALINEGWTVRAHYAKTTFSKYLFISKGKISKKIRFSNHKPNRNKENINDCDYYVGISHNQILTTEKLLDKLKQMEAKIGTV